MAEHLYMSAYISYPRTETTAYAASFDAKVNDPFHLLTIALNGIAVRLQSALQEHMDNPHWGAEVKKLLSEGITPAKRVRPSYFLFGFTQGLCRPLCTVAVACREWMQAITSPSFPSAPHPAGEHARSVCQAWLIDVLRCQRTALCTATSGVCTSTSRGTSSPPSVRSVCPPSPPPLL